MFVIQYIVDSFAQLLKQFRVKEKGLYACPVWFMY